MKVGSSEFIPSAMKDTNGEWIGFEIDVANKLTKDPNLGLELVPGPWEGIIRRLLNKKFDIIISGMSMPPQRTERVAFSAPMNRLYCSAESRQLHKKNSISPDTSSLVATSLDLTTFLLTKCKHLTTMQC